MTDNEQDDDLAVNAAKRRRRDMILLGCIVAAMMVCIGVIAGVVVGKTDSPPASAAQKISTERVVNTRYDLYGEATWPQTKLQAPAITAFRDQSGKRISLSSLRGRTVALTFFDSYCHTSCPLEGRALARAEEALPKRQRPVLVAVSVDLKDNPKSVAHAIKDWGLAGVAPWYWLMGSRAQLAPIWREYHIYVHDTPNNIVHTEALFLIGKNGHMRSLFFWPFAGHFVTHDLRVLDRESAF